MEVFAKVRFSLRRWQPLALVLLCASVGLAQAQSAVDDAAVDPPSRVARLSYMEGDLGFLPAGATDWSDASINRPLTTGDRLSTGQNARAELELGGGTLRMAGQSDFGLLNLNDQLTQIELTQGSLNISVRSIDPGQSYEIDTPTLALVVDQPGTFRVDIDGNGQSTEVTALDGNATVYGENSAQRPINAGRRYRFDDAGLINGTITDVSGGDAFDAWCSNRDRQYAQSTTTQYVSQDVVGYQDLAQNGDWDSDSNYGAVWYPSNVDSNWAPYQDGSWAYIAPWGWSWVDNSRWGFAPYHYGRWAHTHRGWGWIPGPIGVRPVYAPALVAFVGGGASWGRGYGGGRPGYVGLGGAGPIHPIGWFPLGPGEIYNPWYRSSRRYYGNVNITNIRVTNNNRSAIINNIDNQYGHYRSGTPGRGEHYVNRDAPRGFTAVPGAAFSGGRNVRGQLLKVDPREVASAPLLARGSAPRPANSSVAAPRSDHARSLPLGGFQRNVVARQVPPAAAFQRGGPAPNHLLVGPQRGDLPGAIVRPDSNVRVLSRHYGNGPAAGQSNLAPATNNGDSRNVQGNPRSFGGNTINAPRNLSPGSNVIPNAPVVMRQDNAPPGAPYQNNPAAQAERAPNNGIQTRAGELPSARFAHPGRVDMPGRNAYPRGPIPSQPGVSYISRGNDNASRVGDRPASGLPQVPQIQRASPVGQPTPANNPQQPRFQRQDNNGAQRDASRAQQQQFQQRQLQQQQQAQQVQQERQQQQAQMQQRQQEQQQIQQRQQQMQQQQAQQQQMQQMQRQQQMQQMQQQRQQQMQQQRAQPNTTAPPQRTTPQRAEPKQGDRASRRDDQH